MKALLVGINSKYIHPSVALYQLKANTSYDCKIIEFTIKDSVPHMLEKIYNELDSGQYNMFAGSVYLWNISIYLNILPTIKSKYSSLKIALGGPEVSYDAAYYLTNFSYIDYILYSEGEESFNLLLTHLDHKIDIKDVSNLYYNDQNNEVEFTYFKLPDLTKINLATLDIPDYEHRIIYLESSRGCPYKCSYCTASLDNNLRFFPLDKVKEILLVLMQRKVKIIKFLDRTFNANIKIMNDLLTFIDENNICTVFQFEVVGETIKKETIEKISSLNKKYLRFEIGIQSTNSNVNKAVNRIQNMQKLEENIYLLNQTNKVDLHLDLIAGLPYETKETFIDSFNRAFSFKGKELQLGFLKFLRGTKMLDMVDEHEYIYSDSAPYEIIQNKYMSKSDLDEIRCVEKSLNRYYNDCIIPRVFEYLFNSNIVSSFYDFFKNLYKDIHNYQKDELFIILDVFFKINYPDNYEDLNYILKIDYLENYKIRPKVWWKNNSQIDKASIYEKVINIYPQVKKEDLYRYSMLLTHKDNIYVIIYKDFNPIHYEIKD